MVYERQIATATRLITKYGQACVWCEPGAPTGSPANPEPGAPAYHAVPIVFLNNTNREALSGLLSMIKGTEVPTGGMRGLMPVVPFVPTLKGRVSRAPVWDSAGALGLIDDNGIDVLNLNGEVILYYLRFAR